MNNNDNNGNSNEPFHLPVKHCIVHTQNLFNIFIPAFLKSHLFFAAPQVAVMRPLLSEKGRYNTTEKHDEQQL